MSSPLASPPGKSPGEARLQKSKRVVVRPRGQVLLYGAHSKFSTLTVYLPSSWLKLCEVSRHFLRHSIVCTEQQLGCSHEFVSATIGRKVIVRLTGLSLGPRRKVWPGRI